MPLEADSRFGPYQIIAPLGAGGMGVVYRALDTNLQREVALKVLPDDFARDPDRLVRFQREAITIARLNHPHVVKIYAVDQIDGLQCIAMEFVEGVTLADFIPAGGLRLSEIAQIALALADAIGAAHARGIVHRDLKPANVMVGPDGWVTVLDFGLAKLRQEMQETGPDAMTTAGLTGVHQVLGTVAYMSPEQAEGRLVDARSDIFSFGVLLYEMATGVRPFQGESTMAVVSSILKDTPRPITELRPDLPADLDRIVRRCLAKDSDRRYQTALDIRNELEDLQQARPDSPGIAPPQRRFTGRSVAVVAAVVLIAGAAAFWMLNRFTRTTVSGPMRVTFDRITSQPGAEWFPSLSPDGKWIVYSGEGAGNRDLFLQSVNGQTPINLTADSDADDEQPAFSPDGERIAFRSSRGGGGLFVMGRTGEAVRRVAPSGFNPAWSPDGMQLAYSTVATDIRPQNAEQRGQIMVVPVSGGTPRGLYDSDAMMPSWSPDGQRIAFAGRLRGVEASSNIGTIPAAGGEMVPVTRDGFLNWNPVWSRDGRQLYFASNRGGTMNIWRVAIDQATGQPQGEPEAITTPATYATHLSLSANGQQLAYSAISETQNLQRVRFNPTAGVIVGEPSGLTTGSRFWANPDPSPEGQWIVFYSQVGPEGDLYVARSDGTGGMRQLTSDVAIDRVPRWSPDGDWIAMFSDRSGMLQIWKVRPDGSELQQITDRSSSVPVWSPDGRKLAVTRSGQATGAVVDADPRLQSQAIELPAVPPPAPRFTPNAWSPDGKWIAGMNGFTTPGIAVYSTEQQRYERLTDFGEWPVWLPDSRRILFVTRGREFHILDRTTRTTRTVFSVVRDTLGPPRLTRDGREAYFSRRITEADVWLATIR